MKKITKKQYYYVVIGCLIILFSSLVWYYRYKHIIYENFFDNTTAVINKKLDEDNTHENYSTTAYDILKSVGSDFKSFNEELSSVISGRSNKPPPPRNTFVNDVMTALYEGVNTYTGDEDVLKYPPLPSIEATSNSSTSFSDTVTIKKVADVGEIIADNCSTQSLLSSDYKTDICSTYAGDFKTINEKCNALRNNSCTISSCCILLNGNKCVAGDVNGPTYLTDHGNTIDYNYYIYRGKTYPENYNPTPSSGYLERCGMYANNSSNISKACMIQMFNDAGCPNPNPKALINNNTVYEYSLEPKQYIQKDLQNAAALLQNNIRKGDEDSRILCNGRDSKNPCDAFNNNSMEVSSDCMIRMFNDAGCPNKNPSSFINTNFINNYSSTAKKALRSMINKLVEPIKTSADKDPHGSDTQLANHLLCYGTN
jgi:hypothetical protein